MAVQAISMAITFISYYFCVCGFFQLNRPINILTFANTQMSIFQKCREWEPERESVREEGEVGERENERKGSVWNEEKYHIAEHKARNWRKINKHK